MKHRTALIVAASIAAVVFAAALAVAVNLGILTVADSSPVGQLTTATVAQAAASPAALEQPATASPAPVKPQRQTQDYVIRKAGKVRIAFSDSAVRFVHASAKGGWKWKLNQNQDRKLTVTFTRGSETYTFVAQVNAGGKVSAKVDHQVTRVAPSSGGTSTWTAAPVPSAPSTTPAVSGETENHGGEADD